MSQVEIMNELAGEAIIVMKELLQENIKPLLEYRSKMEKEIADKAIKEMYKLEEDINA